MNQSPIRSPIAAVDRWFTPPEPNAAGRLGLFRILFALFYLWHLSPQHLASLHGLPQSYVHRMLLVWWAPAHAMPLWAFLAVEAALVGLLVLLMFGYQTRVATAAVLGLGCMWEAWHTSVDSEHSTVLIAFYIPAFMLISGRWGDTYSLDSLLRRRAGGLNVEPSDSSWPYFLPARAVLVAMAVLFFSSALYKLTLGGTWLERSDLLGNIMLDKNVKAAVRNLPVNPFAPYFAQRAWLHVPLQYFLLAFEAGFILALCGRRIRNVMLSTALIFHAINALWLVVTFTPLLIAYALFVDLEKARRWLIPRELPSLDRVSTSTLVAAATLLALAAGLLWNAGPFLRNLAGLGGTIDWRSIWYLVLPLAALWWIVAVVQILQPLWLRSSRAPATFAAEG